LRELGENDALLEKPAERATDPVIDVAFAAVHLLEPLEDVGDIINAAGREFRLNLLRVNDWALAGGGVGRSGEHADEAEELLLTHAILLSGRALGRPTTAGCGLWDRIVHHWEQRTGGK
jgi:hypothetical protein